MGLVYKSSLLSKSKKSGISQPLLLQDHTDSAEVMAATLIREWEENDYIGITGLLNTVIIEPEQPGEKYSHQDKINKIKLLQEILIDKINKTRIDTNIRQTAANQVTVWAKNLIDKSLKQAVQNTIITESKTSGGQNNDLQQAYTNYIRSHSAPDVTLKQKIKPYQELTDKQQHQNWSIPPTAGNKKPGLLQRFGNWITAKLTNIYNWVSNQNKVDVQALVYNLVEDKYAKPNDVPIDTVFRFLKFSGEKPFINKDVPKQAFYKLVDRIFKLPSAESLEKSNPIIKYLARHSVKSNNPADVFRCLLMAARANKVEEINFFASQEVVRIIATAKPEILQAYVHAIVKNLYPVDRMHFVNELGGFALGNPEIQNIIIDISHTIAQDLKSIRKDPKFGEEKMKGSLAHMIEMFENMQNKLFIKEDTKISRTIQMKAAATHCLLLQTMEPLPEHHSAPVNLSQAVNSSVKYEEKNSASPPNQDTRNKLKLR